MKKFIALCLSLALCLGSAVTVMAAGYQSFTFTDEGGNTMTFDAAEVCKETLTFMDPEGYVSEEEITVLNVKPGSSVKITGYFGANAFILVNGMYEMSPAWYDLSSGSVDKLFDKGSYMYQVWANEDINLVKLGEAPATPATSKPAAPAFSDVAANAYYANAVKWAVENGMVSGQTFGGNTPCTRSATVTYLWKLEGSPDGAPSVDFSDIHANADYAEAVRWAVYMGVTAGTSETTFSPDTTCTRGQIATFLYRSLAE